MPVIIEWTYIDGTQDIDRLDAQVWRKNENKFTRVFVKSKEVAKVRIDPFRETPDINESNNSWPSFDTPSKFQLFKAKSGSGRGGASGNVNPMQRALN